MTKESEQVFTVALLIDELKHEEVARRLESMRQLKLIADTLGPDRTRTELIPFLADSLDDDDEVLLVMASELGSFTPQVGGPEHAVALLSPLEQLATMEDAGVRDKAVQSMVTVCGAMSDAQVQDAFVKLIRGLAVRDWFTARISACSLFVAAYPRVSASTKEELRGLFSALCKDDTPMVRRAAAQNLGPFAGVVEPERAAADLVPLFTAFCADEQDSVRLLAAQAAVSLLKVVPADVARDKILPKVLALAQDKSWRVRWNVADAYKTLVSVADKSAHAQLLEAFISLLRDAEAEVRSAAAANVTAVSRCYAVDVVVAQVIVAVNTLARDGSEHVREALASNVMGLAPAVGMEKAVEQLLPIYLQLLKDEVAGVRLAIIADLGSAHGTISVDLLSSQLLPAIKELADDKNWRIRAKIIEYISTLAAQLDVGFFDKHLVEECVSWLTYKVFAVREAAAQNLVKLVGVYGKPWGRAKIFPPVLELKTNAHYLYRLTAITTAEALMPAFDQGDAEGVLVPLILALASDPVPNVRFGVAKAVERLCDRFPSAVAKQDAVKACLRTLSSDPDVDVKYYSRRAMKKLEVLG